MNDDGTYKSFGDMAQAIEAYTKELPDKKVSLIENIRTNKKFIIDYQHDFIVPKMELWQKEMWEHFGYAPQPHSHVVKVKDHIDAMNGVVHGMVKLKIPKAVENIQISMKVFPEVLPKPRSDFGRMVKTKLAAMKK